MDERKIALPGDAEARDVLADLSDAEVIAILRRQVVGWRKRYEAEAAECGRWRATVAMLLRTKAEPMAILPHVLLERMREEGLSIERVEDRDKKETFVRLYKPEDEAPPEKPADAPAKA